MQRVQVGGCFAAQQRDEAIESGQQALKLYRGDFLGQATGAPRTRFVQLSIHLGELLARRGDHAAALAAVDPVLGMEPWNEDATVIAMRCHAHGGTHGGRRVPLLRRGVDPRVRDNTRRADQPRLRADPVRRAARDSRWAHPG